MKLLTIIVVVLAAAAPLLALQPGDKAGVFLTLPQGARPTAMGEAFTAINGDIYSGYWNPAGLAEITGLSATASVSPTYLDMYYGYFAAALPRKKNVFGLAVGYFDYGDLTGYDEHARNQTTFGASDVMVAASFARRFSRPRLQAGVALKLLRSAIENESATAVMLDLGASKRFNRLTTGLALRNLGPGLKYHQQSSGLPITASIGATYYFPTLPLVPAVAVDVPLDDLPALSLGAEYTAWDLIALRAGLRTDRDAGWASWLRFGFGIKTKGMMLDYAVIPAQNIGFTHTISIGYRR